MIRLTALILATLALTGCRSDGPSVSQAAPAALSTANVNDHRAAKPLFGTIQSPSSQPPEALGFYSRGCQAGAVALAETGPTWQAMRLSRNRNWGQPVLVDYIEELSRFAASQPGWAGLYVGDMSQPRGGPMLTGHASHQSGLDVDIWMLPPNRLNLSRQEREDLSSVSAQRANGAYVNSTWSPQHEAIVRRAASDPRVDRIFIFPGAKVAMCESATGDRSWLRKVRPWFGHHFHFHVRLTCPAGDRACEAQAPIPPGDGCDDARQWVQNIVNPQPRDPNAPPPPPSEPRREVTMASLPAQCTTVLNSN